MKKVELLAPVGNMEKFKMALHYGADAVFLGGKMFNLRAGSNNLSDEELEYAVNYAHERGKKVYVTLNVIPHNQELDLLPDYVKFLDRIGVDGVIVADLGVFQVVKENTNLSISVSTQASNTNWRSVKMWKDLGARRVVLAREISLDNIAEIRAKVPDIELEVFVHGAMCMAISGRCLLSNYMTGRDANRGDCAQACRWKYNLVEETRPGEYMPVYEDEHGTYIFNSRDLCTIEIIDKILDLGVDSLKIEGRMKGIYYVANAVKVYRDAIDSYYSGNYKYNPKWLEELESTSNRSYTKGFYLGKAGVESQNYNDRNSYSQTHQLVAKVEQKLPNNEYILAIRNRLLVGEKLEVVSPGIEVREITLPTMILMNKDKEVGEVEAANPNSFVKIKLDAELDELDMLRKKI
ncbi:peptidase U32 family protein [Fusobacterium mortiferum]|uniref:U32 family peptidase n=2 Tax=Fusobacterium TaxID=848 RepID=A0ABS2G2G8_FUSMR|nr:U32 family peptidase [uncultured Fusobacterium sp.]MBM6690136.1 U32 family peptidase [Fusobacterium mortiferum]MBM6874778.1 U32 family peptidase [Fusobacterium mortiferum]MBU3841963.1 U32 family peptidase [Candidatus Fusobacterium pullicola]